MIADKSKATDSEKAVILIWAKKKQDCWREQVSSMRRFSPPYPPEFINVDEDGFRGFQFLVADLYNQALTYGEFARKRNELITETRAKKEEIGRARAQQSEQERAQTQRQYEAQRKREEQRLHELEVTCIGAGGSWQSLNNTCWGAGARSPQEVRIVK
jgi:hypothetical protein